MTSKDREMVEMVKVLNDFKKILYDIIRERSGLFHVSRFSTQKSKLLFNDYILGPYFTTVYYITLH